MSTDALRFRSSLDDSKFAASLRRMETGAVAAGSKISSAFAGLGIGGGTLGLAAIGAAAHSTIERLSALRDAATGLNFDVENYQRASFVLSQAGGSAETAQKGLANLSRSLVDARDPASAAGKAISKLGLDLASLDTSEPVSLLASLGDAYVSSTDKAGAFSAISDLVGSKVAARLVPALAEGGAAFRKLAGEADIAAESLVDFAERFGDARDAALATAGNTFANHMFALGKTVGSRFTQGAEQAVKAGAPGWLSKIVGASEFMNPAGLIIDAFDPESAAERAGLGGATDPEADARNKGRELEKAATKQRQAEALKESKLRTDIADIDRQFRQEMIELERTLTAAEKDTNDANKSGLELEIEQTNRRNQLTLDNIAEENKLLTAEQERTSELAKQAGILDAQARLRGAIAQVPGEVAAEAKGLRSLTRENPAEMRRAANEADAAARRFGDRGDLQRDLQKQEAKRDNDFMDAFKKEGPRRFVPDRDEGARAQAQRALHENVGKKLMATIDKNDIQALSQAIAAEVGKLIAK